MDSPMDSPNHPRAHKRAGRSPEIDLSYVFVGRDAKKGNRTFPMGDTFGVQTYLFNTPDPYVETYLGGGGFHQGVY